MKQVHSVFLSYALPDRELVQKLIDTLEAGGITTCFSARNADAAPEWQRIEDAIKAADAVVIVVGAKEEPDRTQQFEWRTALEAQWEEPNKRLIPLLLRKVPLPSFLSGKRGLRVHDPKREWGKAVEQLLHLLKNEHLESGEFLATEREAPAKRRARLQYIEEAAESLRVRE